jgi:dTDP-4-dehydrorhamnose 3,5-epimerase
MNIGESHIKQITTQSYAKSPQIQGVEIKELPFYLTEDGSFLEIVRFHDDGTLKDFPHFSPKQISQAVLLPGSIKAFHLHYNQADLWFIHPRCQFLVGLFDVREDSDTYEFQMRITLGGGKARLLYIPPGVAHGLANLTQEKQSMIYFTDQFFDASNPDEHRLSHDYLGTDFWEIHPG